MKRRSFLKNIPGAAITTVIGGHALYAEHSSPMMEALHGMLYDTDRVLIIIQLNGGSDGLNVIFPLDQYDNLKNARGNILMNASSILKLTDKTGIHPAMDGIYNLFQDGKAGVIQSVGYPNFSYSHFRASDIWVSGADSNVQLESGWAGRYLNYEYANYPVGYPNAVMPDPLAIRVGDGVGLGLQMLGVNMGIAINNASDPVNLTGNIFKDPVTQDYLGKELGYIREVQRQTDKFGDVILAAYNKAKNLTTKYPSTNGTSTSNNLTNQLKIVSRLIAGGLKTRIYWVSTGGFDTHAAQVEAADLTKGAHATLLKGVSDNIAAFMDDCKLLGTADRVAGFTFSEFGRRIKSNASLGTDHGSALPVIYFGNKIIPAVVGKNPVIPANADSNSNLPMLYDFRSVYGTFLNQWFCVPQSDVNNLLFNKFQNLPILNPANCLSTASHDEHVRSGKVMVKAYPNPFVERTKIDFESNGGYVRLDVINNQGSLIKTLIAKELIKGSYTTDLDLEGQSSGIYYIRWQNEADSQVKSMMKVR
ncbi:MAG: DUF1501 domain-containing protein [Saprospiraceae bacterium]